MKTSLTLIYIIGLYRIEYLSLNYYKSERCAKIDVLLTVKYLVAFACHQTLHQVFFLY